MVRPTPGRVSQQAVDEQGQGLLELGSRAALRQAQALRQGLAALAGAQRRLRAPRHALRLQPGLAEAVRHRVLRQRGELAERAHAEPLQGVGEARALPIAWQALAQDSHRLGCEERPRGP